MTSTPPIDILEVVTVDGVTVVRFLRRSLMDPMAIEAVGDTLTAALKADRPRLLMDFSKVESVASGMVGRLVAMHKAVDDAGGRVAFCGVGPFLGRIFSLCHLPASITTHPDEAAGLAALRD